MGGYEFRLPALFLVTCRACLSTPFTLRCAPWEIALGADAQISCTLITSRSSTNHFAFQRGGEDP